MFIRIIYTWCKRNDAVTLRA